METLDPKDPNDSGYQRLLNTARAKKLRDYLLRGQDQQDVFLPTSVLLATEKTLDFNATTNVISFDPTIIGPLSVVDGLALERFAPDVKDEPRPVWNEALLARVVIAQELPARRFPRRVTKVRFCPPCPPLPRPN